MKTIKGEDLAPDARRFLDELDVSEEGVVYEQGGKPRLVILPPRLFEQRRDAKQQLFALVEQIRQRNPDLDSDAVLDELEALASQGDER